MTDPDSSVATAYNIATWDGAVEIQTNGESEVKVKGPYKYRDDGEAYIRLSSVVDDRDHDNAASAVSLTFTVSDAQTLATILTEIRLEEPDLKPGGGGEGSE